MSMLIEYTICHQLKKFIRLSPNRAINYSKHLHLCSRQAYIPYGILDQRIKTYYIICSSRDIWTTNKTENVVVQPSEIISKLRESFKTDESKSLVVPLFKKALLYTNQIAIKDMTGEYSYLQLYVSAKKLANQLSNICGSASSTNVAFLCSNNILSPLAQWACWISGQIAMPLNSNYPLEFLKYLVQDAQAKLIVCSPENESIAQKLAAQLDLAWLVIDHTFISQQEHLTAANQRLIIVSNDGIMIEGTLSNDFYTNSNALLLYTSGTTGKPKGVVLTHKNLDSQIKCLGKAWKFTASDSILHVLPLNHVHGCINALLLPLNYGAKVVMHDQFNSHNVWSTMLGINAPSKERINIFMAVPTMYTLMIAEFDKIFAKNSRMVEYIDNFCRKNIRLMVSGSAPLPITIFQRWRKITGHSLLERYGMTEVGMALSNPYFEDSAVNGRKRSPGTVGMPLPDVKLRLVDPESKKVLLECEGHFDLGFWAPEEVLQSDISINDKTTKLAQLNALPPIIGNLHVAGPNVFKEYFNRPEEPKFLYDEFFETGDVAAYEHGVFKILGRASVDIIKTGGQKVSSLEIETLLFTYPDIKDVAVVGIPDTVWGERIGVICTLRPNTKLDLISLKLFCSQTLPTYMHPRILKIVDELPRNNMGKINKRELIEMYFCNKK